MTSSDDLKKQLGELQKQLDEREQAFKKELDEREQAFKKQLDEREQAFKKQFEKQLDEREQAFKKQLQQKDVELEEKDAVLDSVMVELKDLKGKRKLESLDKDSSKKKSATIYTAESTSSEEEEEDSSWCEPTSPPSHSQEQYHDDEKFKVWCGGLQTIYSSKHAKIKSLVESRSAFRSYWNKMKAMMGKDFSEQKEQREKVEAIRTAGIARFARPLTRPEHMGAVIFQDASGKFAAYQCPGYILKKQHIPCKKTINPYNSMQERNEFSAWELDHTPTWSVIKSVLDKLQAVQGNEIDWVAVSETICCVRVLEEGEKQVPENNNHGAVLRCKSCHTASESFQNAMAEKWRVFLSSYFLNLESSQEGKGKERESSPEV